MSHYLPRIFLILIILSLACGEAFAAKGLVIYKSHPENSDDLAIIVEYEDFKNFGTVANITPAGGGEVIRTSGKNVVQAVEYQDFTSGSFSTQQQVAELKAIPPALGELAQRFPRARDLLADEARRINTAVQLLEQGKILVAGQWKDKGKMDDTSPAAGVSLTITTEEGESRTFTSVKVTGQEPDSLRIMHSEGAATIPFGQLSEADQKKYGFDPAKAEEFRKQKAMASSIEATGGPATATGGLTEEELIAKFQREHPDKSYVEVYEMARAAIKEQEAAAAASSGGMNVVAAPTTPDGLKSFLDEIGEGLTVHPREAEMRKRFVGGLKSLDSFYTANVLEKGKTYAIDSLARQSFGIRQRTGGVLLINDIGENPCAILKCEPAAHLDGTRLGKGQRAWAIGTYVGDQEVQMTIGGPRTFPVFQLSVICWDVSEGTAFINFVGVEE